MSSPIRKEVRNLKGYTLQAPPHRIKLNQNESPYDLPEFLKKKILGRVHELSWNRYPTPFADSLCRKIAEREGWIEEGTLVGGGSNVLIQAILIASSVNGKVLTVTPGFSLYEIEGSLLGNSVIEVPLVQDDFSLPRQLVLETLKKEKPNIVFLANPNAPTGTLFAEEDLLMILKEAKGLVVIDEAYFPFSGKTLFPFLKKFPNLILLRTLSKAFSLAGIRLGFLLGDPKVVAEIKKVVLPFSVGILSQAVGEVILDEASYVGPLVIELIEGREFLYQGLKEIPKLRVFPSHANFILFQSPQSDFLFKELLREGILIRDVSSKGLPNALRVTVGTTEENRQFLEAMKKILPPQKG